MFPVWDSLIARFNSLFGCLGNFSAIWLMCRTFLAMLSSKKKPNSSDFPVLFPECRESPLCRPVCRDCVRHQGHTKTLENKSSRKIKSLACSGVTHWCNARYAKIGSQPSAARPKRRLVFPTPSPPKFANETIMVSLKFNPVSKGGTGRDGYLGDRDRGRGHPRKCLEMPTIGSPASDDNAPEKHRDHKVSRCLAVNAPWRLASRDCAINQSAHALASGLLERPDSRLQRRLAINFGVKIKEDASYDAMIQDAPEREQKGQQVAFERTRLRKREKGQADLR
jgi:hypothetical protein